METSAASLKKPRGGAYNNISHQLEASCQQQKDKESAMEVYDKEPESVKKHHYSWNGPHIT